ncbi:uncharacterized protein [Diadema antillarum]|uniref:uncharacterized protein n=1 Tax=Diadema antillarum TaxID=105358 RepID=UPI003A85C686
MADPVETPQEFKYETKFVVLNYLGILPKFEEMGGDSEESEADDEDSEGSSYGMGSQASSHSRETSSSIESDSRDSEDFRQIRRLVAASVAVPFRNETEAEPQSRSFPKLAAAQPRSLHLDTPPHMDDSQLLPKISEDTCEGFKLISEDVVTDALPDVSQASYATTGSSSPSVGSSAPPSLTISHSGSPRPRKVVKKRKSKDLLCDEGTKDRMKLVLSELETQFKKEMQAEGLNSSAVLCAISREALVAERIAQIGDCIMMHHQGELETAFHQVMGHGEGSMNYGVFKSAMKSLVKNTVPGWYHLAVMMKFTRQLAVNVLHQGSRGVAAVTDYASRYIEENLAQAILEQGGWDAMTMVDLDKIDSDTWSEISSGNPSPFHNRSPMPASPPIFTDQAGFLTPHHRSVAGTGRGRDQADSAELGVQPAHQEVTMSQTDSAGAGKRRVKSDTDAKDVAMGDDDSSRGRASSFGTGSMIAATAAAATAAVAVGAVVLLKK